ncbi:helix-turn-helix domain-containing protein [Pseudomaricurvus sp.]|uniref:helix-turn-helix domain-containing protein n=1 Tax=Pseudomaricurvus sp. TaxID=2004510 RepID=UPI003F6BAC31
MEFSLHIFSLITLFGISTGLLLALQLWVLPWGNQKANRLLSLHLANYIVLAVTFVLHLERTDRLSDYHAIFSLQLLVGPLFYFYVQRLTYPEFQWRWSHLWHLAPALLMTLLWQWQLPLNPDSVLKQPCLQASDCDLLYRSRFIHRLAAYISMTLYALASLWILRPHLQRVKAAYSTIEGVTLHWLKILIGCKLLTLVIAVGLEVRALHIHDEWTPASVMSMSPLILTLLVGWFGLQQRKIQLNESRDPSDSSASNTPLQQIPANAEKKYLTSSLSADKAEAIWQQLRDTMAQQQPYLETGLKIADLAQLMDIPSHHLSEVINSFAGQTFYDFINHYRVDEASRLLQDPTQRHLSVTDIGLQAGFNSNSTYFAHFKKRLKQTPRQYRQQHQA